jgi:hypothetical protein
LGVILGFVLVVLIVVVAIISLVVPGTEPLGAFLGTVALGALIGGFAGAVIGGVIAVKPSAQASRSGIPVQTCASTMPQENTPDVAGGSEYLVPRHSEGDRFRGGLDPGGRRSGRVPPWYALTRRQSHEGLP